MKRKRVHLLAILVAVGVLGILRAHPGGLDAAGGHTDRKTGTYHFHRAPASGSTQASPATPAAAGLSANDRQTRIQEYWRKANAGLAETPLPAVRSVRDVSTALKERIRKRDGNQCVICGSTLQLEVDHRVALENGGTNDAQNLATLCDDCHTIKTRMDHSLRRHREKLGR